MFFPRHTLIALKHWNKTKEKQSDCTCQTNMYRKNNSPTVASIQIYFEGAKSFPSQVGGRSLGSKRPKPEARRAKSRSRVLGGGQ